MKITILGKNKLIKKEINNIINKVNGDLSIEEQVKEALKLLLK